MSLSYCGRFLYPRVIDGEMPSIQIDLIRVEGVACPRPVRKKRSAVSFAMQYGFHVHVYR